MNDYISIISSLIIFLFPYLGRKWFNPQLLSSTVVSLGLLGTFGGIMYGLWVFSVEQIDSSIKQLLEGEQEEEVTDKQLLLVLENIEKNTQPTATLTLVQEVKFSNEQLKNNFQSLNDNLQNMVARELHFNTEALASSLQSVISNLDNRISEQINQTILKIYDILEQQLQHIIHSQEFNQTIQEQLQDTLSKLQETIQNIETFLGKSNNLNMKQNHVFMEQVTSFGEFIKGSEQQMSSQLNRMEEKYERELTELEKFTKTLMTIIKKLSQDHDTLYKKTNDVE